MTASKSILLQTSKAPNLPIAPTEYDQKYVSQLLNTLRLYFNQIDNINQTVSQRVTSAGLAFPDGTDQTTAYVPGSVEAFDLSSSIAITTTPTVLKPASQINSNGVTYDPTTGIFTFQYAGGFALSVTINVTATAGNQIIYLYAQQNTGTGWVNIPNSGKSYFLIPSGQVTQITFPQAVVRTAGEKIRYYIYSADTKTSMVTTTLTAAGSPTVYVPAIRIQYA